MKRAKVRLWNEPNPDCSWTKGQVATGTHDCYRHGTVTLFAALNYLNGKILDERAPRHRHQEWLKFLKRIDSSTPSAVDRHLILDNYATHKHPKVMRGLAAHPRFYLHFTLTSASMAQSGRTILP